MEFRPYQVRSIEFHLPRARAFTVAPAGSGKTLMAAGAASRKAKPFETVIWLANTREQVEQAYAAMDKVEWAPAVTRHACCVAGLPDVSEADILIIDECHHLPAATWWATASKASCVVWGYSATPVSGDPDRDAALVGFFGAENFMAVSRDEVMAGGSLADGVVHVHDLDIPGAFDAKIEEATEKEANMRAHRFPFVPREEHERRARWQFTAEAVQANAQRNARIVGLAKESDACLVLVASIEHGETLKKQIAASSMVYSRMGAKKRKAAIAAFRDGALRCMIATSLADEGLDVPRAAVLVLAAGGRSAAKLEQRAGRVMRPHASKDFGIVHDFADRGARMAAAQFRAREKTYRALGYKIIYENR